MFVNNFCRLWSLSLAMWAKRRKRKIPVKEGNVNSAIYSISLTWSKHDLGSHQHLSFIADETLTLTQRNRHTQTHHTQQNIERHTHMCTHTYMRTQGLRLSGFLKLLHKQSLNARTVIISLQCFLSKCSFLPVPSFFLPCTYFWRDELQVADNFRINV